MARGLTKKKNICQCSDPGCPSHKGKNTCDYKARVVLRRVDMMDITGTPMCENCAQDAMESGLFFEDISAKIKYGLG